MQTAKAPFFAIALGVAAAIINLLFFCDFTKTPSAAAKIQRYSCTISGQTIDLRLDPVTMQIWIDNTPTPLDTFQQNSNKMTFTTRSMADTHSYSLDANTGFFRHTHRVIRDDSLSTSKIGSCTRSISTTQPL